MFIQISTEPAPWYDSDLKAVLLITILFLALASAAGLLVRIFTKLFLKELKMSFGSLLLYASIGGIFGLAGHYYAISFAELKNSEDPGSIQPFVIFFLTVVFCLMLTVPAIAAVIRNKNLKIKKLENNLSDIQTAQKSSQYDQKL